MKTECWQYIEKGLCFSNAACDSQAHDIYEKSVVAIFLVLRVINRLATGIFRRRRGGQGIIIGSGNLLRKRAATLKYFSRSERPVLSFRDQV